MAAAENALKSKQAVSAMLKQGFISDPTLTFSPTRSPTNPTTTPTTSKSPNSPTLFEMMSEEQQRELNFTRAHNKVTKIVSELQMKNPVWWRLQGSGDVKLSVVGRDGVRVCVDVHRSVLSKKSRFFAEKLRKDGKGVLHSVEICDCDDVEVYLETVVLMYCEDLKRRLIGEDVSKVLGLLTASAAIMFDAGIGACLEYLEAVPWSEDEEEKVISHISQLQLNSPMTGLLQRVSLEPSTSTKADDIFTTLLTGVLQAKDDKARREMKTMIFRLLREDSSDYGDRLEISKDTLYHLCHRCLGSLVFCLSEATNSDENRRERGALMGEIAREADNVQWLLDILIEKRMGEDFVKLWADQTELAVLHSKIPVMYRHEISRITAQLCVAIGRGFILVPRDARYCLLSAWLDALYDDFGWMRRASRSIDKKLIEDGISQTILTLPLQQQQAILLNWFDCFLNKGDDCPNLQRAFEVWWRRAFIRQYSAEQENSHLQITVCDFPG